MAQTLTIDKNKYTKRFFDRLNQRRTEKKYDFTILVGSQAIYAEQNVLACGSDYFNAMFSHDTEEKQTSKVEIRGVDFESVKACVDFIYRKDVVVLPEKYEDLMCAADMMQLTELCDAIEENMENNLNVQTIFSIRNIANKFGIENLQNECQEFAEAHFDVISKQDDFLEMEYLFLKNLLLSKQGNVDEDGKLEIVFKWVRHSENERNKNLMELIKCVKLSNIHLTKLREYIQYEPLINMSGECLIHFSISVIDSASLSAAVSNPCESLNSQSEVLVVGMEASSPSLKVFNVERGIRSCNSLDVSELRGDFTLVEHLRCVYVLKGDKSVYCLSFTNDAAEWVRKQDMLEDHGGFPPSVSHSGFIYVIGGCIGFMTNATERFDSSSNMWRRVGLLTHKQSSSYLSYGGFIYQFGGWNNGWTNQVSRVNTSTGRWENLAPMVKKRGLVATTKYEDLIFVSGGMCDASCRTLSAVEQYDPAKNQWTTLPSMKLPRADHRLYAIQGFLYAVGGGEKAADIEKYDLRKRQWTIVDFTFGSMEILNGSVMCDCLPE